MIAAPLWSVLLALSRAASFGVCLLFMLSLAGGLRHGIQAMQDRLPPSLPPLPR